MEENPTKKYLKESNKNLTEHSSVENVIVSYISHEIL